MAEVDADTQRALRHIALDVKGLHRKLDMLIGAQGLKTKEGTELMSIQETITRIQDDVRKNKDASDATQKALEGYAKANEDLTQKLKDAIAAGGDDGVDEATLKEIADALEANTSQLMAAAQPTAAAVVENTPAA